MLKSQTGISFTYDGKVLAGSVNTAAPASGGAGAGAGAGAAASAPQTETLKGVFEKMEVAEKLNIPGAPGDLLLTWTDPEDKMDMTWTVNDAVSATMDYWGNHQEKIKIKVTQPP